MLYPVINNLDYKSRQFFLKGKCLYKWLFVYKILRLFTLIYRPYLIYKTDITNKSSLVKLPARNLTTYNQALNLNIKKSYIIIINKERN